MEPPPRKLENTPRRPNVPANQDRQRVRRACEVCRKKKIKCDGDEPCQRCVDHNVDCEYADYVAPIKTVDANVVEQLESRMASMEQLFRQFIQQFNGKSNTSNVNQDSTNGLHDPPLPISSEPKAVQRSELIIDPIEAESIAHGDESTDAGGMDHEFEKNYRAESPPYCYADGFGELDTDITGQLRYVGIGSTACVVDTCVGLRRHINRGIEKKGYEVEEAFLASHESSANVGTSDGAYSFLNRELPPTALTQLLVEIYIKDVYFLFPIITKDEIREIHARLMSEQTVDAGASSIFFSVLAIGTLLVSPTHPIFAEVDIKYRHPDFGSSLYQMSLNLVNSSRSGIRARQGKFRDMVVALGLLSMYLASVGMQAEAWIMVGRAVRHGQDLGLHRSPAKLQLPKEERSRRRYAWWCLYILERQLCTALGRPLSIDDADCDVEIPCEAIDGFHARESAGFISLIHLHKIMGGILKTVNSVRNVDSWREVTKYDELRTRVRDSNLALQFWAKEHVPHEIRSAKSGKALVQKHIALSAFFSAVLLLHRIFMSNPHRPSPLTDPQAQVRCAKAAVDCIHGASDFLQHVPRSHYLVFHGQYVFVSAIVLLQFVRGSNDGAYNAAALKDIQSALAILQMLEKSWNGAKKCGAIVEEYLEFTYHVLEGGRKGVCNFEHAHRKNHSDLAQHHSRDIKRHGMAHADLLELEKTSTKRKRPHASYPSAMRPAAPQNAVGNTSGAYSQENTSHDHDSHAEKRKSRQFDGSQPSGWPTGVLKTSRTTDTTQSESADGTSYFDNIVDNGLGPLSRLENNTFQPDSLLENFDFDLNSPDISYLCPELWTTGNQPSNSGQF